MGNLFCSTKKKRKKTTDYYPRGRFENVNRRNLSQVSRVTNNPPPHLPYQTRTNVWHSTTLYGRTFESNNVTHYSPSFSNKTTTNAPRGVKSNQISTIKKRIAPPPPNSNHVENENRGKLPQVSNATNNTSLRHPNQTSTNISQSNKSYEKNFEPSNVPNSSYFSSNFATNAEQNIRRFIKPVSTVEEKKNKSNPPSNRNHARSNECEKPLNVRVFSRNANRDVPLSYNDSSKDTSKFNQIVPKSIHIQSENIYVSNSVIREIQKLKNLNMQNRNVQERSKTISQILQEGRIRVQQEFSLSEENAKYRNSVLSDVLFEDFKMRRIQDNFIAMLKQRKTLPAFQEYARILEVIESNQVVVLVGETGCGKTTQVPQFILDLYILSRKGAECRIVCTQPRRISAIGVAERVAAERCIPCGENKDVGYHIRLEYKKPREYGSILFCTTGIMLVQLQSNPYLKGISHIIVDEVHERDMLSDFFLMLLKDILNYNKDLKIILMSATVNAELFSSYFADCPIIRIPGFMFTVEKFNLEDTIEMTHYVSQRSFPNIKEDAQYKKQKATYLSTIGNKYSASTITTLRKWNENELDLELILATLIYICSKPLKGSILVFLPGMHEIQYLYQRTEKVFSKRNIIVIPLHSETSSQYQNQILEKTPPGCLKIILSTNIAETSITFPDCAVVIDSGKFKLKSFDPVANMHILSPQWIALSNAKQRRGRAGRTQPGVCYHLFTSLKESSFDEFQIPEMQRSSLEEIILNMKILKNEDVYSYFQKALSPPKPEAIEVSLNILRDLNALNNDEELTPLGYLLAKLPVDVHLGKLLLLSAIFSCLDNVTTIVACLSYKDPFQFSMSENEKKEIRLRKFELAENSQSDHLLFVNIMQSWWEIEDDVKESKDFCRTNFLSYHTLKKLKDLKEQYAKYLKRLNLIDDDNPYNPKFNVNSDNESLIKSIICASFYPNIVKVCPREMKENKKGFLPCLKAITKYGETVYVHPRSVNTFVDNIETNWLAYHMKMKSSKVFIHDTTGVNPHCMLIFGSLINIKYVRNRSHLTVDNWIKFEGNSRFCNVILFLKEQFDRVFEEKILNPSVTDWTINCKEIRILRCVMKFISQ